MKSLLLFSLLLFSPLFTYCQPYNLVPCSDFECVEYFKPTNETYCNNPCCENSLFVQDLQNSTLLYSEIQKYREFYCGPWLYDTRGGEVANVGGAPTLLSRSINNLYNNSQVYNNNADYWDPDENNSAACIGEPSCSFPQYYICPQEFGVPINTFGNQDSPNIGIPNNNYIGLRSAFTRRDGIKVKLNERLIPCVKYVFECDAVRKTSSETQFKIKLTPDGNWSNDQITGGQYDFDIDNANMDNAQWTHFVTEFTVDEACEWLHLRIESPNLLIGHRTALFDNIQIYRKCDKERALSSCKSFDNNIGEVQFNNIHTQLTPFTILNLANFNAILLKIYNVSGEEVYSVVVNNPPNNISWNGKSSNGDDLANGYYTYQLFSFGCAASCIREGSFMKTGNFPGSLNPEVTAENGLLKIDGLLNATYLELRVLKNNNEVFKLKLNNPSNVLAWNGKDNNLVDQQSGIYQYKVVVGNSCEKKQFEGEFNHIVESTSNPLAIYFFNYQPSFKTITLGNCGYLTNPAKMYFDVPDACCEHQPQINLNDVVLDGELTISAIFSIVIGSNVTITPGSNITFRAGNSIEGLDNLEFDPELGANYTAEILQCPQRLYNIANSSEPNNSLSTNNFFVEYDSQFDVYPNPNKGHFSIISNNNSQLSNLQILSIEGKQIELNYSQYKEGNKIEITMSELTNGVYFISFLSNGERKYKKIIIIN